MANTVIQLKNSTVTGNVPSSLANGEISINSRDGKFFYSTPAGVVVTHYPYLGPAGLNQEIQFNDSGTLGSNSGLTFNKTTGLVTVPSLNVVTTLNATSTATFKGELLVDKAGGAGGAAEGGEIHLAIPTASSNLSGPIAIDIYQNKIITTFVISLSYYLIHLKFILNPSKMKQPKMFV